MQSRAALDDGDKEIRMEAGPAELDLSSTSIKKRDNILDLSIMQGVEERLLPKAPPESSIHSLSTGAISNQKDSNGGTYRHNYTLSFISDFLTPLTEAYSLHQNGSPSSSGAFKLKHPMSRRPPPDLDFKCVAHS